MNTIGNDLQIKVTYIAIDITENCFLQICPMQNDSINIFINGILDLLGGDCNSVNFRLTQWLGIDKPQPF